MHTLHCVCPLRSWYEPLGHESHASLPFDAEKDPPEHGTSMRLPAKQDEPAAHTRQPLCCCSIWLSPTVPAGQFTSAAEPSSQYVPFPQGIGSMVIEGQK
eukprot:7377120-Prymnesium_polylepis.2